MQLLGYLISGSILFLEMGQPAGLADVFLEK